MKDSRKSYGVLGGIWLAVSIAIFVLFPEAVSSLGFYGASLIKGGFLKLLAFPFVHSSFLHLVENIFAVAILILLALDIEFSVKDFLWIGLGSTYAIALFASWVYPYTVIVGSSLGIFALFGAMAVKARDIIPMYYSFGAFVLLLTVNAAFSWYNGGGLVQDIYHSLGLVFGAIFYAVKVHYVK